METAEMVHELGQRLLRRGEKEGLCVAFSGDVASTVILAVAKSVLPDKVSAITVRHTLLCGGAMAAASQMTSKLGAAHYIMDLDILSDEVFRFNPKNRCYLCKKQMYAMMMQVARDSGTKWLIDGTDADDVLQNRPGLIAAEETGVYSPLAKLGYGRQQVRQMADYLGIAGIAHVSSCFVTRLPHGTEIKAEMIEKINAGEECLKINGFPDCRMRVNGETVRIEIPEDSLLDFLAAKDGIVPFIKNLGFCYITLDMEGIRPDFDGDE